MSELKLPMREIIRGAILHNKSRAYIYRDIMSALACSRSTAKSLFFAFLYNAEDKFLRDKLKELEPERK